jgi:sarcosine oxidase
MPRAIVVGAGVFGASVADRLTRSGWEVVLVDSHSPGHVRSSSGDESRILRCAHGLDRWYARSVRRARELWLDLEAESGRELYVECGVAWFAQSDSGWEAESEESLRAEGVPVERMTVDAAAALFPSFSGEDLRYVLLEPEAGVLRSREATAALARRALANGAKMIRARALPDGAGVALDDGTLLEGDRVVWACGAWLARLFPDLAALRATHQDVFYFAAPGAWATPSVPAWVDYDGATYGVGDLDGRGFKTAPDREGPDFDPEHGERIAIPHNLALARAYLATRFPALAEATLIGHRTCQYELTPDTHFVVAPHPDHENRVWLVGGGSGHGFKHGPALAEVVEALLLREAAPDPRFALGPRAGERGLRTAGGGPRAVSPT